MKRIVNLVLAVLFVLFAAVQYNDPDPWQWGLLYAFVAFICGFAAFGKFNRYLIWLGLAVIIIWMATLIPELLNWIKMGSPNIAGQMKAETPYIEFTREFFGLVLAGMALLWVFFQQKKK